MIWQDCDRCKHDLKEPNKSPCDRCCLYERNGYEPKTNADRIRNMSDDELAEYLSEVQYYSILRNKADSVKDSLEWLQAEVKEGVADECN